MYTNENAPSTCGSRFSAASVRSSPCSVAKSSVTREVSFEESRKGRVRAVFFVASSTTFVAWSRLRICHGFESVEVREVAVVGQRHGAERGRAQRGLSVLEGGRSGRRIPRVTDCDVPLQELEVALVEDLGDQAHVTVDEDLLAVAGSDAGRFLPPVLQGIEPEVGEFGGFFAGCPDSEHTAFVLRSAVLGVDFVRQLPVSSCHE
jgi:hypothetical protein